MDEPSKELETRDQIIEAARHVFVEKGLNGARMQEIADRAGINKALLHYYFTSKQMLFDHIFNEAFAQFWPNVSNQLTDEITLRQLFRIIMESYIKLLQDRPYLPIFILNELQANPDKLERLIRDTGIEIDRLLKWISLEIENGNIYPMKPTEVIINFISLCIFPFAGRPLLQRVWFNNDSMQYDQFIQDRTLTLIPFFERAIFTKLN